MLLLGKAQRHSSRDQIKMASVNPAFQLQAVIQGDSPGPGALWAELQNSIIPQCKQFVLLKSFFRKKKKGASMQTKNTNRIKMSSNS